LKIGTLTKYLQEWLGSIYRIDSEKCVTLKERERRTIRDKLGLQQLPIVGLTANAMASDRERCLQAGMNEHLAKPFELTQLVAMIQRLVRGTSTKEFITTDSVGPIGTAQVNAVSEVQADIANALAKLGGMVPVYKRAATASVATAASRSF
jgi:DNA-binding NarL/FixJ family response regulator